ncbi:hypothetical protein XvhCFBP2543_02260 [Xanthomonas vasicola]|nr:hypothetical protein XvhCFBP2543_02260 [Xanthomonas vasicola]
MRTCSQTRPERRRHACSLTFCKDIGYVVDFCVRITRLCHAVLGASDCTTTLASFTQAHCSDDL